MKRLKILRVVPSMNPARGGVAEAVRQGCEGLAALGHKTHLVCFDNHDSPWVGDTDSYTMTTLGRGRTGYRFKFRFLFWLAWNVRDYDHVVFDGLWLFHTWGAYVVRLFSKVPYSVFTHGMLDPFFNANKLKYIKKWPFWWLVERPALNSAANVLFTCSEERELASQSFPGYSGNGQVVGLGIGDCGYSRGELAVRPEGVPQSYVDDGYIVFLSRIHPKKGLELLIDALSVLSCEGVTLRVLVVGPSEERYLASLRARADAAGLGSDQLYWVGMVTGVQKWQILAGADAFVLPSHQENFGIVVAEALSVGTPVLISNKVNIWREIEQDGAGIVGDDTVEGIRDMLLKWESLGVDDKAQMKTRAISTYRRSFSQESASLRLESVIGGSTDQA